MVALTSRRQPRKAVTPEQPSVESLATCGRGASGGAFEGRASRRDGNGIDVVRSRDGEITQLKIGRWRQLSASPQRRLAEVRELSDDRIAVKIERLADGGARPSSEIWQLYDREGRLEAAMQSTPDGKFAILTNYQTRQACRLVANGRNELETVEAWNI
jgi:hypothetical protein